MVHEVLPIRLDKILVLMVLVVGMASLGAAAEQASHSLGYDDRTQTQSIDVDVLADDVFFSKVHFAAAETGDVNIEIVKDGTNTVVASKTVYADTRWANYVIDFSQSDYSSFFSSADTATINIDHEVGGTTPGLGRSVTYNGFSGNMMSVPSQKLLYDASGSGTVFLEISEKNHAPQFNSTSVSPDPPLIGENVSYGAEVYDSDGSIDYTNLTVSYGGSTVVSDAQRTGTTPSWNDIYKPQSGNKWLNATLETVDDKGAVTTKEINRYLSNEAPNVDLSNPQNQTYWRYDVPVEFSVEDDDSKPDEDITCSLYIDGNQYDTRTVVEGSSFSTTTEAGLGSHEFKASCSDPAGNVENRSVDYSVDAFDFNSVTGSGNSFEKVEENFQVETSVGDMVEEIEYRLNYSNQYEDVKTVNYTGNGVLKSESNSLLHVTPFVSSDGTSKKYNVYANVSYTKLNGNSDYGSYTSSIQTQSLDQAYKFGNHSLEDGFTQLEGSTLSYTATVDEKTSNSLADINVETVWNQTGEEKVLNQGTGLNYSNTFNTDLIGSSQETHSLETNVTLQHNGDTRSFTSSKPVSLDKIKIESSSNADNEKTLEFISQDEVNQSSVNSNLELGLNVSNPDQPGKTRFYGFDVDGASTHSFFLNPGYAEVNAQAFQKNLITYQNSDKSYTKRNYYLLNENLDNQTTSVNLYMLKNSEGRTINFEVLDSDLRGLENHVVRVERNFPSQEQTRVVSMLKTDNQGQGKTFLDPGEQYIYTVFNSDGELVDQIGPQGITDFQTTLEINDQIPESLSNQVNDVRFTDIQEKNQSVVVEFVSDTEKLNNITLKAREENTFSTTLLDRDSSNNLQGMLKVEGFNSSSQQINYILEGTFGGETVSLETGSYGTVEESYGDTGIFMSLLMFVALTVTGLWRPSASIGLGVVGLFLMYFIGFISISQTALISVVVLGAVMVWRMS